eukprot:TRINITY_DN3188_c0_g1_i1.p1 TRINITY_DN3188_c0_g1~~TRINITY_DN3188_c0_g1_i1.p1  ORF type:complete len:107 (-),score=11.78 TRINITY_DN3188_c0_g1_i1:62-382(-)
MLSPATPDPERSWFFMQSSFAVLPIASDHGNQIDTLVQSRFGLLSGVPARLCPGGVVFSVRSGEGERDRWVTGTCGSPCHHCLMKDRTLRSVQIKPYQATSAVNLF